MADRARVRPIRTRKRFETHQELIRVQFVIQDEDGAGWLVVAQFGPDIRGMVKMAMQNHRHVSDILGTISTAAGIAMGHPHVTLEALPLTEQQFVDLKKIGAVRIW